MPFDAFISYSHAADAALAAELQSALHRFAKPWYRLRALRVFRDATSLSLSPELWPEIESALGDARYFLLMACPAARDSRWVAREAETWVAHKDPDRLLIVLTDGELVWDEAAADFDWERATALPQTLRGRFKSEPLYVDCRGFQREGWTRRHPAFVDRVATVAARLHGRSKDDLFGEDVRQHRRARRLAAAAITGLALLAVAAATLGAVSCAALAAERNALAAERAALAAEESARTRAEHAFILADSVGDRAHKGWMGLRQVRDREEKNLLAAFKRFTGVDGEKAQLQQLRRAEAILKDQLRDNPEELQLLLLLRDVRGNLVLALDPAKDRDECFRIEDEIKAMAIPIARARLALNDTTTAVLGAVADEANRLRKRLAVFDRNWSGQGRLKDAVNYLDEGAMEYVLAQDLSSVEGGAEALRVLNNCVARFEAAARRDKLTEDQTAFLWELRSAARELGDDHKRLKSLAEARTTLERLARERDRAAAP
jgi:hypothetical protein